MRFLRVSRVSRLSPSSLKGLLLYREYQALAPAQERRLAADHGNRQRGPLPLPARPLIPESSRAPPPIGPADLLHFTCSTHVLYASYGYGIGMSVVRRRTALQQAAVPVFPVCSRRIKSLNSPLPLLPMIRQPPPTNGTDKCRQECCTFPNTRDGEALAWRAWPR